MYWYSLVSQAPPSHVTEVDLDAINHNTLISTYVCWGIVVNGIQVYTSHMQKYPSFL